MQTIDEVRDDVRALLARRPDIDAKTLGAHTRLADTTVRHFIDGRNLSAGHKAAAAEFQRVVRLVEQGDILPVGMVPVELDDRSEPEVKVARKAQNYYGIETTRAVAKTLSYCAEFGLIGVVTGDYGVGKTRAVEAWRRGAGKRFDSWVYEFSECTARNMVGFLHSLCELVGASGYPPGTQKAYLALDAIVAALNANPGLVILDQCETVTPRVMQLIRQIWDRTRESGVGFVLLAAPVLMTRLRASRIEDLGALSSRVGAWTQLRGLSREELAEIVKREGVTQVDEDALSLWWRAVGGSMRRLMTSLQMIQARHAGKVVNEKTIVGVAAHLWGMSIGGREVSRG